MPVVLLDRLPLPSLEAYTVISVLLLSCSVYYAVQVTGDANWRVNYTNAANIAVTNQPTTELYGNDSDVSRFGFLHRPPQQLATNESVEWTIHPSEVIVFMCQEPLCIWTLINMAYCCLILLGKFIQKLVFGELRVSEQQHIKDKFWNFVFYKFIFVFGVINVQFMDEVVLWCSWFSVLGFLHLLTQLCKDRFEYLSFSPTTPRWSHIRLLSLLSSILVVTCSLFLICVTAGLFAGVNTFAFMAAECILLMIRTSYVMVRYCLYLYEVGCDGPWELRGTYAYYTELGFELAAHIIDLVHHLHMLLWSNIFLSMASLVICMQLRFLCHEIQRRLKKHANYRRVVRHVQTNYPMATLEELDAYGDNCAICWDKLDSARKLPCHHYFHNSCLRSWLEQDTSCPTCRQTLNVDRGSAGVFGSGLLGAAGRAAGFRNAGNADGAAAALMLQDGHMQDDNMAPSILAGFSFGSETEAPRDNRRTTNHFFHFDGSRYVSWLPSFSVEVTHTQLLRSDQQQPAHTSQLDTMGRQIQQMFPHISMNAILEDLRNTRSMEMTIENILEDRLVPSPPMFLPDDAPSPPSSPTPVQSSLLPGHNQTSDFDFSNVKHSSDLPSEQHAEDVLPPPFFALDKDDEDWACEDISQAGGRFSKSPQEREHMLKRRREVLISQARRRYLANEQSKQQFVQGESEGLRQRERQSSLLPS